TSGALKMTPNAVRSSRSTASAPSSWAHASARSWDGAAAMGAGRLTPSGVRSLRSGVSLRAYGGPMKRAPVEVALSVALLLGFGGCGGKATGGGAPAGSAGTAGTGGGAGGQAALFTVEVQLASDINANAPGTIGIVTWSVTVAPLASAHIEFG